ncbi:MAG: TlpA disulfide reductase family protein [Dehalococcoidia bacterium]
MQDSSPKVNSRPPVREKRIRRLVLYLLTISPVLLLIVLLAWGQLRSEGRPGGLVEHNELGEVTVTQRAAPAFDGIDLETSTPVNLESLQGNVVMVSFWSSWCVSCRAEAADLASVYHEYEDQPVEFIGIAIWDDNRDVLRHMERFDVQYPNIIDSEGASAVAYGVRGTPEKFFLDEEGQVVRKVIGPVNPERLRGILDEMLVS